MSLPKNLHMLKGISLDRDERGELFTFEATAPTGFERFAADEVLQKMKIYPVIGRGRIMLDTTMDRIDDVLKLRCIDNVYVVVHFRKDMDINEVPDMEILQKFCDEVGKIDWPRAFQVWTKTHGGKEWDLSAKPGFPKGSYEVDAAAILRQREKAKQRTGGRRSRGGRGGKSDRGNRNHKNRGPKQKEKAEVPSAEGLAEQMAEMDVKDSENGIGEDSSPEEIKDEEKMEEQEPLADEKAAGDAGVAEVKPEETLAAEEDDNRPVFRVTCYRAGDKHKFGSPEAACEFGGACTSHFGWKVKMSGYDMEIVLNIEDNYMYVTLRLNKESLYHRNVIEFGPTTMRATLAFGMLQAAGIQPGWIVLDPLSGSGAIPVEGMQAFPDAVFLAGDNFEAAPPRTAKNAQFAREQCGSNYFMDSLRWDARRLPIRTGFVDAVVTDLPFGRRMGSRYNNRDLYVELLEEFARILKPTYGVVVCMTEDYKTITNVLRLPTVRNWWRGNQEVRVNIGGLRGNVYIIQRSGIPYRQHKRYVDMDASEVAIEQQLKQEEKKLLPPDPEEEMESVDQEDLPETGADESKENLQKSKGLEDEETRATVVEEALVEP